MSIQAVENVMVDIETLGTSGDCVILSVGACGYDRGGELKSFYEHIAIADSLDYGCQVDADTLMWWFRQGEGARMAIVDGQKKSLRLDTVLKDFAMWLATNFTDKFTIWSNGASFDIPILANAFRKAGMNVPWKFWNERCFRTVKSIYSDIKPPVTETAHNALDDAMNQLQHLNLIIKAMA